MRPARFPNPIFVALDVPDLEAAERLARSVKPHVGGFKIGLEFLTAQGPDGVKRIVDLGLPVFADAKFHDIPNTVAGAARALARLGVHIFNVHASGGEAMMRAAAEAAREIDPALAIIAVTVLTSLDEGDLGAVGQRGPASEQVARLAALAARAGLDGVVSSAKEIGAIRKVCGKDFLIATPGIRPAGGDVADQRRVMGPREAFQAGADILVIGRPIARAADPKAAAQAILAELGS
ncbi:MAG TPA: orotidine-5'-phosphate decarboxylase [Rhizomicrobium sp.]|jgi:orotidine-5'-phosphate decarboxylase|nr:orotidine-5'-phosphate decarboxylase [Rhizomicrobium sp.]